MLSHKIDCHDHQSHYNPLRLQIAVCYFHVIFVQLTVQYTEHKSTFTFPIMHKQINFLSHSPGFILQVRW